MGNICITTGGTITAAAKESLDPQAIQSNAHIEKELKDLKKQLRSEIKILLLGTGECGKTTFMRQMLNMFHQDSTMGDQSYRMLYAENIRENVLQVLWCITEASNDARQPQSPHGANREAIGQKRQQLLDCLELVRATLESCLDRPDGTIQHFKTLNLPSQSTIIGGAFLRAMEQIAKQFIQLPSVSPRKRLNNSNNNTIVLGSSISSGGFDEVSDDEMANLWRSYCAQWCSVADSCLYMMKHCGRIFESNYVPTDEDILRMRIRTTSVVTYDIDVSKMSGGAGASKAIVIDVGGQKNERRKWMHYFENVDLVIYVTSLADYDRVCAEDVDLNRLTDSLQTFQSVVASDLFVDSSFMVFFNKDDQFKDKVLQNPTQAQRYVVEALTGSGRMMHSPRGTQALYVNSTAAGGGEEESSSEPGGNCCNTPPPSPRKSMVLMSQPKDMKQLEQMVSQADMRMPSPTVEDLRGFIKQRFNNVYLQHRHKSSKSSSSLYMKETTATDKSNAQSVINACLDVALNQTVQSFM